MRRGGPMLVESAMATIRDGARGNRGRATAVASVLLLLSAVLAPATAPSSGWPTSGTPPAPDDPDYQPVETGYPTSCSRQSDDDEQRYHYGLPPQFAHT